MAAKRLVIVESPAKAKTIAGYLGDGFVVESSVGHIRDLPERAADIPAEYKKEKWARLGVNIEHDFEPLYVVDPEKKQRVAELRKQLSNADELDGGADRPDVALAASHREGAAGVEEVAKRPPVQLRLRHEPQVAARPERHPERPGIEVRGVVRGDHEASLRDVLAAARP